jgi:hypothetical protein
LPTHYAAPAHFRARSIRLWHDGPNAVANAIGYATHGSRSHDAVIRVYDDAGNVIDLISGYGYKDDLSSAARCQQAVVVIV